MVQKPTTLAFRLALAFAAATMAPVLISSAALSAECQHVTFPDSVKAGASDLVLNGLGLRKATLLAVKIYVAGLYLPEKSPDSAKILDANKPWQLVLRFVHDADASDIRDAFDEGFRKSAGGNAASIGKQIESLKARMIDFQKGQYLSYTYDPAAGIIVDVNGASGAAIEGVDFAKALLGISIGSEPPNEDLKSGLLGAKCE